MCVCLSLSYTNFLFEFVNHVPCVSFFIYSHCPLLDVSKSARPLTPRVLQGFVLLFLHLLDFPACTSAAVEDFESAVYT